MIDPLGLKSPYDGLDTIIGGEAHFIVGGGFTYVTCQDECDNPRTMIFVKVCAGAAAGVSGTVGNVAGLDGSKCNPSTYEGGFVEFGIAVLGLVGGFLDVGDGVIESGLSVGPVFKLQFVIISMSGMHDVT